MNRQAAMTPMDVMHRSGLLPKILETADDGSVPFEDLTPGDVIRVSDDWWTIRCIRSDRKMRLVSEDEALTTWYPADVGERFLRMGGF